MVKVAGFDRAVNDADESGPSLSPAHHLTVTDGARVRIGSRLGDPVYGVITHRLGAPSPEVAAYRLRIAPSRSICPAGRTLVRRQPAMI